MAGARAFTLGADRVIGTEARAATAGAGGLRVGNDAEASAHHGFDEIDDGSGDEGQAHFVDNQFDTVRFKHAVTLECAVINRHAIRVAAATAGFDEDAHGGVEFVVFGQDFERFLRPEFSDLHHVGLHWKGCESVPKSGFSRG
jgi:hypothetical protein